MKDNVEMCFCSMAPTLKQESATDSALGGAAAPISSTGPGNLPENDGTSTPSEASRSTTLRRQDSSATGSAAGGVGRGARSGGVVEGGRDGEDSGSRGSSGGSRKGGAWSSEAKDDDEVRSSRSLASHGRQMRGHRT